MSVHSPRSVRQSPRQRIRRRYKAGAGGWLYCFISLFVAIGAFNSQNNLLFWTFGFALALLIVSGILSGWMLMGIRVHREPISPVTVGEPMRIRYRLSNINRLVPAFALSVVEREHAEPPRQTFMDRLLRRERVNHQPPLSPIRAFAASVPARRSATVETAALAMRRGQVRFNTIQVVTSFPFGLIQKSIIVEQPAESVVLPKPADISMLQGVLGDAHGHGSVSGRRQGLGEEFFALRDYRFGDSPRQIAWRSSARRGSLLVREFSTATPRRLCIVLRLRPAIGSTDSDERAISIAAALATRAENEGVEYAVIDPLTRLHVPGRRGDAHLRRAIADLGYINLGPDDGRGSHVAFPTRLIPPHATAIVVHSGPIDRGFGLAGLRIEHVGSDDHTTTTNTGRPDEGTFTTNTNLKPTPLATGAST